MKFRLPTRLALLGLATVGAIAIAQPGRTQESPFFCQVDYQNLPTTYANTPRGPVAIFKWKSQHWSGSGYTPLRRCQEVTARMNTYDNTGQLEYLSAGWHNRQPVICAGVRCNGSNLLFTLRPDQSPSRVLSEMRANRAGAAGPSWQSNGDSATLDLDRYLQEAPVENLGGSSNVTPDPGSGDGTGGGGGNGGVW